MTGRAIYFRGRREGFTLLELLVATAVGAIVLLVINATFFGALRLHNTTHERVDRDLVLQRTINIVRQDIAGLLYPGGALTGQLQSLPDNPITQDAPGERISPDFYTTTGRIDGWSTFSEAQVVAYYLKPDPNGNNTKSLVRVVTRNLLPVQNAVSEEQTLLTGLQDASVAFYDGTNWDDTWDSTTTPPLPAAIKFRLTSAPVNPGEPASAPVEVVVALRVANPTTTTSTTGTGATG